jgi:hypothetical protein
LTTWTDAANIFLTILKRWGWGVNVKKITVLYHIKILKYGECRKGAYNFDLVRQACYDPA